jgi:DNA-binding response OmpR family regulator
MMIAPPERHVIIVEDNNDVAEAFCLLFEASGYAVTVAHTVAGAVAACRTVAQRGTVADLMLLDITLPDASGLDALEQAAASGVRPRVTVALTGHADARVAADCLAAGCRDVVLKPVGLRELVARANTWLA